MFDILSNLLLIPPFVFQASAEEPETFDITTIHASESRYSTVRALDHRHKELTAVDYRTTDVTARRPGS